MVQQTLSRKTPVEYRLHRGTAEQPWRLKGCLRCGGDQRRSEEGWLCLQCGRETPLASPPRTIAEAIHQEEVSSAERHLTKTLRVAGVSPMDKE